MKSSEIRQRFLDYFARHGHTPVASSSLIPGDDPTLLFTNAGMVQFKDVFLGRETRPYVRAVSSQRCLRAGGKHNDLENVGYTARHHTFFEMLGNFSFGDYFKRNAIQFAWGFLTEELGLLKERLWVTVYHTDNEAYTLWTEEIGVPAERVIRIGDKASGGSDNFWQMGDTGPCGPCTEIFYDHGVEVAGGPPGSPDEDGDRYIEIWNLVFMQFNRDASGTLHPLPKPSVDTGMGLERISAVMQHVHSNYDIDLFQTLTHAAAHATHTEDLGNSSLKVIADHIRACAFLITDGVIPGNEGRGYVLRRIIRRAIRHGYKLGERHAFFFQIVPALVTAMGAAYPELVAAQSRVMAILQQEEARFFETIEHGMGILEAALKALPAGTLLDGELAFKLHDTYGFPLDLTADICREMNVGVDTGAFDAAMAQQKAQARAAGKFKLGAGLAYSGAETVFHGYDTLTLNGSILALYKDGVEVDVLNEGELGVVVLDHTPFYAESGGQAGDSGMLRTGSGVFAVEDTLKIQAQVFGHHGVVTTGTLKRADVATAQVDAEARLRTVRNHSATHLMHKALREVLGEHVQQKGSLVDADKTRFDFVQPSPMNDAQIRQVEERVNAEILANLATRARVMPIAEAQTTGAMMLFGEKYGDDVRVLDIGSSRELCGGIHVNRTGDIGVFKILHETGVAAGVRRVEAVTGNRALQVIQAREDELNQAATALKAQPGEINAKLTQMLEHTRAVEKELERLKSKFASAQGDELITQAKLIGSANVLAATLEGADAKGLRETLDKLRDKLKSSAIVLGSAVDGRVSLIAGVSSDLTNKVKAGDLVNFVAQQVGGKGGGRADMAQAGGTEPEHLPRALASVHDWLASRL